MPVRPFKLCKHPGCGRIAEANGYCKLHQSCAKQIAYVKDKDIHNMYSHKWQIVSKDYLSKHPWCEDCLAKGIYTAATEVHHKKKHKGNAKLFWDRSNWMSLCHRCHSIRTRHGE